MDLDNNKLRDLKQTIDSAISGKHLHNEYSVIGRLISQIESKAFKGVIFIAVSIKVMIGKLVEYIRRITISNIKHPVKVASFLTILSLLIYLLKRLIKTAFSFRELTSNNESLLMKKKSSELLKTFFYINTVRNKVYDTSDEYGINCTKKRLGLTEYYEKYLVNRKRRGVIQEYDLLVVEETSNTDVLRLLQMQKLLSSHHRKKIGFGNEENKEGTNRRHSNQKGTEIRYSKDFNRKNGDMINCSPLNSQSNSGGAQFYKIFWAYLNNAKKADQKKQRNKYRFN
mmetsp:Transcript_29665/g.30798  ORF Transcript_29665/g.30798 Transcript_29665/m.30798 type:complete len:284 (+) Transcript_29665:6-857(+)